MASDKQRQQRKAEKRHRREARKRDTAAEKAAAPRPRPGTLPGLSETLTEFADPLAALAGEMDPPLLRQLLVAAAGVWNAELGSPPFGALPPPTQADVEALARRIGVTERRVKAALDALPARKRSRFRSDGRVFTQVETFWGIDEIRVRVMGTGAASQASPGSLVVQYQDPALEAAAVALVRSNVANDLCEDLAFAVRNVPDRTLLAASLLAAGVRAMPSFNPDVLWRFAAAVVYAAGPDATRAGYRRAVQLSAPAQAASWGALGVALAVEEVQGQAPGSAEERASVARSLLAKQAPMVQRAPALLGALAVMSPSGGAELLTALLAALPDQADRRTLAVWAALAPLAAPAREAAVRFLGGEPDPAGRDVPSSWFVLDAVASLPDQHGCQIVAFERMGPGPQRSAFVALVGDRRGLIDASGLVGEQDALSAALAALTEPPEVWPVPKDYVVALVREAVARSAAASFPLPISYVRYEPLLAGLGEAAGPDVAEEAEGLHDPELLPHTGGLWHHASFAAHGALEPHSEAARALLAEAEAVASALPEVPDGVPVRFPRRIARELDAPFGWPVDAAGLAAIDAVAGCHLAAVFTPEFRLRLCRRLQHAAYLFECSRLRALAELAATAAWALAPESQVPLADQPFVRDMIRAGALFELA